MPTSGQHDDLEPDRGDVNHEKRCMDRIRIKTFSQDLAKVEQVRSHTRPMSFRTGASAQIDLAGLASPPGLPANANCALNLLLPLSGISRADSEAFAGNPRRDRYDGREN